MLVAIYVLAVLLICSIGDLLLMDWSSGGDQNWYYGNFNVARDYIFGFEVI